MPTTKCCAALLSKVQVQRRNSYTRHGCFAKCLVTLGMLARLALAQSPGATSPDAHVPRIPAESHAASQLREPEKKVEGWETPITQLNQSLPSWLRLSGEFRNRVESLDGIGFRPVDDVYNLTQLRLGVYIQPVSWLKIVGVTQDARVFFNHHVPNAPPNQNIWDVREAYVQFGRSESGWVDAIVGRQVLAFGSERVIGPSDWVNMGRTFDAARVNFRGPAFTLSVFAASVIIAVDGVVDHHYQGNNLYGAYSTWTKVIPHATLEPYVFWRLAPAQLKLPENAGLGHLNEVTIGARLAGKIRAIDYEVEMNKQTGSLGAKSIDAWAGHWNVGYTFERHRWKPRPFGEYNYASGNKDPNENTWRTHDEIYPSSHDKMDFADQFGWRNISDLRFGIRETISRKWTFTQVIDNVWLASKNDALYNSGGAISVGANPAASSRHVGTELEFIVDCKQNSHMTYGFGVAHLFTGTFLNESTKGKDVNYPFAYVTVQF